MESTLEIVRFRTHEAVTDAAFLKASEEVSAWANAQPGFQYRCLTKEEDGGWLDLVFWADLGAAKAASEKFMAGNGKGEFMTMIDPSTVEMRHLPVRHAMAGDAAAAA